MNPAISIGDVFNDTEEFGNVKVKDIFISPTTGERVYIVADVEDGSEFYCNAASLHTGIMWTKKEK